MEQVWKALAGRVEERNEIQLMLLVDNHVIDRLKDLIKSKDESHRLSAMLSDEAVKRAGKRRHREFCSWEKRVKSEVKRDRKLREKEKKTRRGLWRGK